MKERPARQATKRKERKRQDSESARLKELLLARKKQKCFVQNILKVISKK
jgi:hypothetical protein